MRDNPMMNSDASFAYSFFVQRKQSAHYSLKGLALHAFLITCLFYSQIARCAEHEASNFLIGMWTSRGDCANPDFVFKVAEVQYSYDADGIRQQHGFKSATYEDAKEASIFVELHEPHGLSGARSNTGFEIRRVDDKHVFIVRGGKKKALDIPLSRCD